MRRSQAIDFRADDGVRIRGEAWGPEAAPAVLLLHGGGQTRHAWSGTGRRLGDAGWSAISLDARGHGESDWAPDADYSPDRLAADLLAIARSFARPPAVVGASLGGMTALLAAGEIDPTLASALVLVDITPRLEPGGVTRIVDFMSARPDGFASLEEAADAIAAYREHRQRPKDLSGLAKNLRRGDDGRYRWHWDPAFLAGRRRGKTVVPDQDRYVRAARRLRVPTLLVRGKQSDVVSQQGVNEFLEAVPHARFVDVREAGHMVAGDRNDAFTAAVVAFLREVYPPRP